GCQQWRRREAGLKAADPASPDPSSDQMSGLPRAGGPLARLPKIAEARAPKGNALGRATAPFIGCGVGTRAPGAPSPALPAGLEALERKGGKSIDAKDARPERLPVRRRSRNPGARGPVLMRSRR